MAQWLALEVEVGEVGEGEDVRRGRRGGTTRRVRGRGVLGSG